jgi:tartrate dehydratase alpha subunit/fumarate hydratase class I-like protein
MLTAAAFRDISHLLRPGHLQQLRNILDDGEASANDKYVALELLKNANIAAGGVLPMCQDTGTAIVMGKKGQAVWTGGGDEAAIARGVFKTYTETNLRYSQVSPISMFKEVQTGTNLPAQIDIYATDGDAYKFLFVAKGGGSANKSYPLPADSGGIERGLIVEIPRYPDPHPGDRGLPALSPRDRDRRHLGGDEPQDGEARLDPLPRRPAG